MSVLIPETSTTDAQTFTDNQTPETTPLDNLALSLAQRHATSRPDVRAAPLLDRLKDHERLLQAAYNQFAQAPNEELVFRYAAEWLLDNFHIVRQALRLIREDLPHTYYLQLPKLEHGPQEGYPRIYALAREVLQQANALLDVNQLRRFVHIYQTVTPLTMGELWALPIMLRLSMLDYLSAAVARVTQLEMSLATQTPAQFLQEGSEDTVAANCIISLRAAATEDWKDFFEEVSLVEKILRGDPMQVYARMDFETRDRYRKVVEELAGATGCSEVDVARAAIASAQESPVDGSSPDPSPRTQHVGYYLIDAGRLALENRLAYHPPVVKRLERWLFKHATFAYIGCIVAITGLILFLIGSYLASTGGTIAQVILAAVLAGVPAVSLAVTWVNWMMTHALPPRVLPRLEFAPAIPLECSTMIVVPGLISSINDIDSLTRQIEMHYLHGTAPNLYFALLTDFADAPAEHMPEDDELIERANASIQTLNARYANDGIQPFFFFHRRRLWNASEDSWMGWERKRGKLHEFNRLLRGNSETSFTAIVGDTQVLSRIKYVITVDSDTIILRGSVRRLIGTLAHPLNRAEFDPATNAIVAGYTILQPRTEINPVSANLSLFTRIFSGDTGLDLYTLAVSDVYQDLFGEGIYVGKGIYDVDAFERSLRGRVPENSLLSHDLFEGVNGRVGLATNITLLEDYPQHYLMHVHRMHRWIRGDWQLLPWILNLPRLKAYAPSRLSAIDRWKIIDNLRRSLLAPALLTLFLAGWTFLPGTALTWTLIVLAFASAPFLVSLVGVVLNGARTRSVLNALRPLRYDFARWILSITFIPYEALVSLDAILITLVRVFVTHKHLLKWITSAHTVRLFGSEVNADATVRHMASASIVSVAFALIVEVAHAQALRVALPLLLLWLLSPLIAYWISRPIVYRAETLSDRRRRKLRVLARRTWFFFERFVGPDDNWLPPDHFQESPRGLPAHRTSPTNIGLLLISTLGAYDMGYLGALGMVLRVCDTFDSLSKLERYRGHWLNWYDTRSLQPLPPAYVSTVDSGNLAACLLVLKQACTTVPHTPVLRWQLREGLLDTLAMLDESIAQTGSAHLNTKTDLLAALNSIRQQVLDVHDDAVRWAALIAQLSHEIWNEFNRQLMSFVDSNIDLLDAAKLRSLRLSAEQLQRHFDATQLELNVLTPWLLPLHQPPALFIDAHAPQELRTAWQGLVDTLSSTTQLGDMHAMCDAGQAWLGKLDVCLQQYTEAQSARTWCRQLSEKLEASRLAVKPLLIGYRRLVDQADAFFNEMDFQFLFDARRKVFHIGYNAAAGKLDDNFYDLLASEARIASLIAIAKRDAPQSHWLHLGRPLTQLRGARLLLSWSGTMFEYLMPSLFMHSYPGTLLHQSTRAAVDAQIDYAHRKEVPWGISESAYYHFDTAQNYQYRAFGVPALGFKRGLAEDLVIAPYASLMALSVRPKAVSDNIDRFDQLHMLGHFGLYESMDYTPSHLQPDQKYAIVRAYMAHHQGMIMLALTNFFHDDIMIERFHAEPHIQSVELLLQEQIPHEAPVEFPQSEVTPTLHAFKPPAVATGWRVPIHTPAPQAHFLSNGRYGVMITNAGSGYSYWEDLNLTRWRADTTLDDWGVWLYLVDLDSNMHWSATYQPSAQSSDNQEVTFYPHKAEFRSQQMGIVTTLEITIAPDDDVEIRRLTLVNDTDQPRRIHVTSYGEIALAPQATDQRHPAFNKLFIESEYLPDFNALLFRRRPRSAHEQPVFLMHALLTGHDVQITGAHESDRLTFVGRHGDMRSPAALDRVEGLSGGVGATRDPIMSLGQSIDLKPHARVKLIYLSVVGRTRESVLNVMQRYRSRAAAQHAFDQARTQSEIELRRLNLTPSELQRNQQLLSMLLYPQPPLRPKPDVLAANTRGQPSLWAYGISGDYPIVLVQIASEQETAVVLDLLQAHTYWRERQLKIDLVILDARGSGYAQEIENRVRRLIAQTKSERWLNRRGGIFVLNIQHMNEADRILLYTSARVMLRSGDALAEQLQNVLVAPVQLPPFMATVSSAIDSLPMPAIARPTDLQFDNGLGGFSADGREYVIYLQAGQRTPLPWINVIANPEFGFWVSESGGGYSWSINSSENRLTPWRNDPVSDTPGEALYLRDEESGRVWTPTPSPAGDDQPYRICHGAGYTSFEHHSHGLKQHLQMFVAPNAPLKIIRLRLENTWQHARRITATYTVEWVLGVNREDMQPYVIPEYDAESHALLARNPYNVEFGARVAFLAANKTLHGLTTDRTEFLGRLGNYHSPAALGRIGLSGSVEAGHDPCAAIMLHIDLPAGASEEIYFLLGQGADRAQALQLIKLYQDAAQVERAWSATHAHWDKLLETVSVRTPDQALDLLLNRWLLYQSLSCRMWGRSALYQSSGAFGFRDQLQDVMAYLHSAPQLARAHILEAARHQFEAGDVLHWWHPPSGRGLRSRCSDDLVWLPYVTAHYIVTTGDTAILAEQIPFLRGTPLEAEEEERYGHYESTSEIYTLYEHCQRALRKGLTSGPHDLPLIGSGDWNDGFNRVGIGGAGESVWLGWFLVDALTKFAPLCELRGDDWQAVIYRQQADELKHALESQAWDGMWYRRATYDDGTPLGSMQNRECKIDSIAQSWAVLSSAADRDRARQAMESVAQRLVRDEDRLVLLFDPPFDKTQRDPGYIKGYPPGMRENGGQYTHAALWVVWAFAKLGQGNRAGDLLRLLNPIYHSNTSDQIEAYQVEPYVIAADVYSAPRDVGHGGWTWYTGSASWMYRLGLEAILGLSRVGSSLQIDPCIPADWREYAITYRHGAAIYHIRVENPDGVEHGVKHIRLDGTILPNGSIPLVASAESHEVVVRMG